MCTRACVHIERLFPSLPTHPFLPQNWSQGSQWDVRWENTRGCRAKYYGKKCLKPAPFHQREQLGLTGSFTPFLTQKTSHGPYGFALIFSSMSRGKAMCTGSRFCRFSSLTQMAHKSWDCSHHCCESESLLASEYRSSESEDTVASTDGGGGRLSVLQRARYTRNSTSENQKDRV